MGGSLSKTNNSNVSIGDCPPKGMQFTLGFIEMQYPNVSHASTDELADKLNLDSNEQKNPDIVVLDIREEKEYQLSHIPTAIWMSPKETPEDIVKKLQSEHQIELTVNGDDESKGDEPHIYCYCSVGWRSSIMANKLQQHGLKNVHNLQGSIFKWVNEGKPIVDSNGNITDKVHTYNRAWGLLLDDTEKRVC